MKLLPLLIFIAGVPVSAAASDLCERMPIDPELPAGLSGNYEIVGKDPITGNAYTATLMLGYGENTYALTRTSDGNTVHGDAWIERCGVGKINVLTARYHTQPRTELSCTLAANGGNYYRTTCKTRQGAREWHGLEAWFQKP